MSAAGIYTRLSHDPDGTSTATARQRMDCELRAEQLGLTVVDQYEDNDISAYKKGVKRPAWERLLGDVAAGRIDTVIVWRSDRFARQPRDLERFLDVAEPSGAQLVSVTEPEFSGRTGMLMLRLLVAFASHESGVKSERIARKVRELAEAGAPPLGGPRRFGYTRDYQPHPVEAPLYREAVARVLAGEPASAVHRDWVERGITSTSGRRWPSSTFQRMLRAPAQAGVRSHLGKLLPGNWEPLVSREDWDRLQAVLDGRTIGGRYRRTVDRHFLTGLLVCGRCGATMGGASVGRRPMEYRCTKTRGGCDLLSINGAVIEDIVERRFLHVVSTPAFAQRLAEHGDSSSEGPDLLRRLREDESAVEQLTKDHYVERSIPRPAFLAAKDQLDERIQQTKLALAARSAPEALTAALGDADALRQEWEVRGPAWRRSVLEACVRRITLAPAPTGPGSRSGDWQGRRVSIDWLV
jgi:site-specific DNA recombinase